MRTQGSACRRSARASPRRVSYFASSRNPRRAVSLSSRVPVMCVVMAFPSFERAVSMSLADARSPAQSLDEQFGGRRTREVLLTRNQIAVANRERTPQPGLHEVRADALQLVFDPPGHDVLVARKKVHFPDRAVSKVFFDVRKSRDRFSLCEKVAIGESSGPEDGDAVAQRGRQFPPLVELHKLPLEGRRSVEGKHRRLATGNQ